VWLSEIMLQQTTVAAVIPYYQRFLATFPTLDFLASAPIERVMALWSGLGYYSRARNLHRCAQVVMTEHRGEFPRDVSAIVELPGIGRSTASAIAAFCFDASTAILEGNVKRVLARHAGVEGYPGQPSIARTLWNIAEQRMPRDDVDAYTQGMMDLGATVCTRSKPACLVCPVSSDCAARASHRVGQIPASRPKRELPRRSVTLLMMIRHDSVLLERRPPTGIWGGLWSLPELPDDVDAIRYCSDRFDARIEIEPQLPAIEHGFTHFRLTIRPQPCAVKSQGLRAEEPGLLWMPLMDAAGAALPSPIRRLLIGWSAEVLTATHRHSEHDVRLT
jgi:A/G-specific adenine glycosylase